MKNSKFDQLFNEVVKNYKATNTKKIIKEDTDIGDIKWHYMINKDILQVAFTTKISNIMSLGAFSNTIQAILKDIEKFATELDEVTNKKLDIMSINDDEESKGIFIQIVDKETLKFGIMFGLTPECDLVVIKDYLENTLGAIAGL